MLHMSCHHSCCCCCSDHYYSLYPFQKTTWCCLVNSQHTCCFPWGYSDSRCHNLYFMSLLICELQHFDIPFLWICLCSVCLFQSQNFSVLANSFVIISVVYILQQWFDLGAMNAFCSVVDTRIHHGMCSSTLPYASETRCVIILHTEYLSWSRRMEVKSVHVMYHIHVRVTENV